MASNAATMSTSTRQPAQGDDLLLRETNHRCSNDLQLIVSLLGLQSRRAAIPEVRQALSRRDGARVDPRTRAERDVPGAPANVSQAALRQVCEALHAQAEPRSILISLEAKHEVQGLSPTQITTLALVVNELATNAIKHAFEEGKSGRISHINRRERWPECQHHR